LCRRSKQRRGEDFSASIYQECCHICGVAISGIVYPEVSKGTSAA
jgi:hypothetical protein